MSEPHSIARDDQESAKNVEDGGDIHSNSLGAPVEAENPLGYDVGFTSAVVLNVSRMIGSGIYSTPGTILDSVGSVGIYLIYWLLGPLISFAGLDSFNELASQFPKRSGGEVVYLEQAYPNPRFLVQITFAATTMLTSYSANNSIIFAQYMLDAFDVRRTALRQNLLAIAVVTISMGACCVSTKWSLRLVNVITFVKVLTLLFFAVTGIFVLSGATSVRDPLANFRNPFEGSKTNGNALATGFLKVTYAFIGWANANSVLAEVKGKDPIRTIRRAGYTSLGMISALYFLVNIAYVAAVPKEEFKQSGQLVAAIFMKAVYGTIIAKRLIPVMIACSCVGNIIAVTIAQARCIREVARQGMIPFPGFFSSTKPWGTPLGPILFEYFLTIFVMIIPPAEDAFAFLVDVSVYPGTVFSIASAFAVWALRSRRAQEGLPPPPFRAWNIAVFVWLCRSIFLFVMPWVPPEGGSNGGDVSFWYATYCVVGLGILGACVLYYYLWIVVLPKWGGYEIVEVVEELSDGALTKRLARRYITTSSGRTETTPLLSQNED